MANVMKVLKEEIARISRSEINAALKPVKSVTASQRRYIAELRRRIERLEKEKKQIVRKITKTVIPQDETQAESSRAWITSAGIRAMRKRLHLSQKAFAELAGVSLPTVCNWEAKKNTGKINIRRKEIFVRLQQIKGMGVRDLSGNGK